MKFNGDYDIYEKTFELVAVGLGPNSHFSETYESFSRTPSTKIEVLELKVDNKPQKIKMENDFLVINKILNNNDKANVFIKFKKYEEDDKNNVMKQIYYGFHKIYAGQTGKFIVKINKDWTVLSIKNDY